ncbi:NAD-dependent epimerase/dehydratase family protein [Bacillus infantis]
MNILVTGGAGFIGSHTCIALLEAGHSVIIADRLRCLSLPDICRIDNLKQNGRRFFNFNMRKPCHLAGLF